MNQALWKLTALAGVVGIGLLFVLQKQGFDKIGGTGFPTLNIPADNGEPGTANAKDGDAKQGETPLGGPESFDQSEPVAAREKLSDNTLSDTLTAAVDTLAGLTQREPAPTPIPERRAEPTPIPLEERPAPARQVSPTPTLVADRDPAPSPPLESADRETTPIQPRARSVEPEPVIVEDPFERRQAAPAQTEPTQPEPLQREPLQPEPAQPLDFRDSPSGSVPLEPDSVASNPPAETQPFVRKNPRPRLDAPLIDSSDESFVETVPDGRDSNSQPPAIPTPATTELPLELEPVERPRVVLPDPALDTVPIGQEPPTVREPAPLVPQPTPATADIPSLMPDDESIRLPAEDAASSPRRRVVEPLPLETEPRPVSVPDFVPVEPVAPPSVPLEPVPSISTLPIDNAAPVETVDAAPARARTSAPLAASARLDADAPRDSDDNADFANRDVAPPPVTPVPAAPPVAVQPVPEVRAVTVPVQIELPRAVNEAAADIAKFSEGLEIDFRFQGAPPPPRIAANLPDSTPVGLPRIERDGVMRPLLSLEKSAPATAVIGRPLTYRIVVRNDGPASAMQVLVQDRIPAAVRVEGTNPQAESDGKSLVWRLGTLRSGDERTLDVRVIPTREGTIESAATVTSAQEVTAAITVVAAPRPRLQFELIAPPRANIGQLIPYKFRVTNAGGSDATGVMIRNVLPAGLRHDGGNELEYEVGVLPPGKSREVELGLLAAATGRVVNPATVTADGGLRVTAEAIVDVVGPRVEVTRIGPKKIFVGRQGTFTNTVSNLGSLRASGLTVVELLPEGLEFVSASQGGTYEPRRRLVSWRIDRLEPDDKAQVQVVLRSTGKGPQVSAVKVVDATGLSVEASGEMLGHGVAALSIGRSDLASPIGVGEETKFRVQLFNRGNDPATGARMTITTTAGYELLGARGPTNFAAVPGGIRFDAVPRIEGRQQVEFEIVIRGRSPGEARVQIAVESDQLEQPLRSEEAGTVVE
jgi:uncharacterized repeat protein (TIGR01451 family)